MRHMLGNKGLGFFFFFFLGGVRGWGMCVSAGRLWGSSSYAWNSRPRPSLWPPALMFLPSRRAESVSLMPGEVAH